MGTRVISDTEAIGNARQYSCHVVDELASWEFEQHLHEGCCDLTFIYRGNLDQTVNGQRTRLAAGMLTFVRDGDLHSLRSRSLEMYTINFRPEVLAHTSCSLKLADRLSEICSATAAPVFRTERSVRSDLLLDFRALLRNQDRSEGPLLFERFLNRWIFRVMTENPFIVKVQLPAWMSELLEYIEVNVERPVLVSDLARLAGKSTEHIARCFRSYLDTTPSQAINTARLQRAALLLSNTKRGILDICFSLGYNSVSYFYRLFSDEYSMTPHQFRRLNSTIS